MYLKASSDGTEKCAGREAETNRQDVAADAGVGKVAVVVVVVAAGAAEAVAGVAEVGHAAAAEAHALARNRVVGGDRPVEGYARALKRWRAEAAREVVEVVARWVVPAHARDHVA